MAHLLNNKSYSEATCSQQYSHSCIRKASIFDCVLAYRGELMYQASMTMIIVENIEYYRLYICFVSPDNSDKQTKMLLSARHLRSLCLYSSMQIYQTRLTLAFPTE